MLNRLLCNLLVLCLTSLLSATSVDDPPKDTGIAFKITKTERISEGGVDIDLMTVQVANESKSAYWILCGDKDPVERHSKGNPEGLFYILHHTYALDYVDHYHIRKDGHWQGIDPLKFGINRKDWMKIGPGQQKEIHIPVAETLVDHEAQVAFCMFFSRDDEGQKQFRLYTNYVLIKAQQGVASQSATRSELDSKNGENPK